MSQSNLAKRRDPGLAAVISLFLWGGGQVYNGQIGKAIAIWICTGISILLCFVLVGFFLLPIMALWSVIDAYKSAQAINQRLGLE